MHETVSPAGRLPGQLLATLLVAFAALHAYWAIGGTWGLSAVLGGPNAPRPSTIAIATTAGVLLVFAASVLAQANRKRLSRPLAVVTRGALWILMVAAALVGGLNIVAGSQPVERFVVGPFGLVVFVLALWTLRTTRPTRLR